MKTFIHKLYHIFFSIVTLTSFNELYATHIVGGQLTYTCLGNNKFEIKLVIRRDCINGADTVYFDDPAEVTVYYSDGQRAYNIGKNGVFELEFEKDDTLRENSNSGCVKPGKIVCVHQSTYRKTITLPDGERGYILAYQRCCRNESISNILSPVETGTTYVVNISQADFSPCNSSPQFGNFPPIYVCVDKLFTFDHSAIDLEGDSLVYSLCLPNIGRTLKNPKGVATPPPYDSVKLKPEYSINNLLNPSNKPGTPLRIDPRTGVLTGVPNTQGQYLVGICISEYKNGKRIATVTRDFELNVVPCGDQPKADFDITSTICNGLDQSFLDKSIGGSSIEWFFDYPNNLSLHSTLQNPSVKYLRAGKYTILLVVSNSGCEDSIKKAIDVIDTELMADFTYGTSCSPSLVINAMDNSSSNSGIAKYNWKLSIGSKSLISNLKNPVFNPSDSGIYTLTLVITDVNGCIDSISKMIKVKLINVELIGGEYILCNGDSVHLVKNPNKSYTYKWSPTNGLNLNDPSDPVAFPSKTTTYKVTVTYGDCIVEKEVTILVRGRIDFQLMGDSTTCDGRISFMANSDSTDVFEWSYNSNFDPSEITSGKFSSKISGDRILYVRGGSGEQCKEVKIIHLLDRSIDLSYQRNNIICDNDSINIIVTNNKSKDSITILWMPDSLIRSGQGTLHPKLNVHLAGKYFVLFTATNQYGCKFTDTIYLELLPSVKPDIRVESECGQLKVKVSTNYTGKIKWNFGDGIGMTTKAIDEYTYSKSGKYVITLTADTICSIPTTFVVEIVKLEFNLSDSIILCPNDPLVIHSNGNPNYIYHWMPDSCFVNPFIPNPVLKGQKSGKYFVKYSDPLFVNCIFEDSVEVYFPTGFFITTKEKNVVRCTPDSLVLHVDSNVELILWCDLKGNEIGKGDSIKIFVDRDSLIVVKGKFFDCVIYDTIAIKFYDFKSKIIGQDHICPKDTIMLLVDPAESDWTYAWFPKSKIIGSDSNRKVTVFPSEKSNFTVKVINSVSCEWILNHEVSVSDISLLINATAMPTTVLAGEKSQLTTINNSRYTYKWDPNDGSLNSTTIYNPIAMPSKTTTYSVTVTDEIGCTGSASVKVVVGTCDEFVFVPNAFSPNGDNKNDIFKVRGLFLKKIEFIVYNRWGQEMFNTSILDQGWDGTYQGEKLSPDVYGWHLKFTCPDDIEFIKKGNVTLLK